MVRSKGTASCRGVVAIRLAIDRHSIETMRELADIVGVHETAACRWLYGAKPSERAAKALHKAFPREITRGVLSFWGYAP